MHNSSSSQSSIAVLKDVLAYGRLTSSPPLPPLHPLAHYRPPQYPIPHSLLLLHLSILHPPSTDSTFLLPLPLSPPPSSPLLLLLLYSPLPSSPFSSSLYSYSLTSSISPFLLLPLLHSPPPPPPSPYSPLSSSLSPFLLLPLLPSRNFSSLDHQ